MEAVTFVNLICVLILFAGLKAGVKRTLLPAVTLILICFYGIRYNYGNDYSAYENLYNFINSNSDVTVRKYRLGLEYGWIYFNRLMKPFGFQTLVFIHTIIQFATISWLIEKYTKLKYQWALMTIYLFWPALMLTELSMMRQTMAMCIVFWGIPLIFKKKYLLFCLFPIIATQFHTSGYVGFLFLVIYFLRNIDYKRALTLFIGLFLVFYLLPDSVRELVNAMLDNKEFGKYKIYVDHSGDEVIRSNLGFIFQILFSLYLIFMTRWKSTGNRFFIFSMLLYFISTPFTGYLGNINRLFIYFLFPGSMCFQPLFARARTDVMALVMIICFFFYININYNFFFYNPIYTRSFLHYHTIFE